MEMDTVRVLLVEAEAEVVEEEEAAVEMVAEDGGLEEDLQGLLARRVHQDRRATRVRQGLQEEEEPTQMVNKQYRIRYRFLPLM
jgi:hypothetical protein